MVRPLVGRTSHQMPMRTRFGTYGGLASIPIITGAVQGRPSMREARASGARVIVIETSDQPHLARARTFYRKFGYVERGRIPDFYADGDAKVIFSRSLAQAV